MSTSSFPPHPYSPLWFPLRRGGPTFPECHCLKAGKHYECHCLNIPWMSLSERKKHLQPVHSSPVVIWSFFRERVKGIPHSVIDFTRWLTSAPCVCCPSWKGHNCITTNELMIELSKSQLWLYPWCSVWTVTPPLPSHNCGSSSHETRDKCCWRRSKSRTH